MHFRHDRVKGTSPLLTRYARVTARLQRADWLLPTLARALFVAVLMVHYLHSGLTKLGDGLWGLVIPSAGAYAQIFPRAFEAAGYDTNAMTSLHYAVVVAGTWAEFALPLLIAIGLLTRLAALGMIGFVVVQSATDLWGHGQWSELGVWLDRFPNAVMLDQRSMWIFMLLVLVIRGAGPISVDQLLKRSGEVKPKI